MGETAEVISGQSPDGKYYNDKSQGLPFYQGKTEFGEMYIGQPTTWTTQTTKIAFKDDILMSVRAPVGPVNFATEKVCIGRGLAAIRPSKKIDKLYLFYFLRSIQDRIKGNGGAVFDSVSRKQIETIKIPLPPLDIQERIVGEIDSYQKIIDGARQIVENYKPTIKIDPDWCMETIGEHIAETKLGLVKSKREQSNEHAHPYIKMDNITERGELDLSNLVYVRATNSELDSTTLNDSDFIYNTRNAPNLVGKCTVYHGEGGKYLFNNNILRIRFKKELNPDFANYYLNSEAGKAKIRSLVSGTTSVAAIYQKNFAAIIIPVPPLSIQEEIVAQIATEQKIVNENKKLIEIFEKKISETIAALWGK